MAGLVKGKNIDIKKVTFSQPTSLDNGSRLVYVNYGGPKQQFCVQSPWMDLAWDLNCYDEGPYPKYSLELSFKGMDNDADLQGFHDKLISLEEKIIEGGLKNGRSWLQLNEDLCIPAVVKSKFSSIVKPSKDKETGKPDGKWPSTMKLKIPFRDDKFKCKVFHKSGDTIDINGDDPAEHLSTVMVKGARVRCIIRCVGLWCTSNFMCQWELQRCEIEVPDSAAVCAFLPDSDDEDVEAEGPKMLDDSDDEDEQEQNNNDNGNDSDPQSDAEPEEVHTPPPVRKTPPTAPKKIRKKKPAATK